MICLDFSVLDISLWLPIRRVKKKTGILFSFLPPHLAPISNYPILPNEVIILVRSIFIYCLLWFDLFCYSELHHRINHNYFIFSVLFLIPEFHYDWLVYQYYWWIFHPLLYTSVIIFLHLRHSISGASDWLPSGPVALCVGAQLSSRGFLLPISITCSPCFLLSWFMSFF